MLDTPESPLGGAADEARRALRRAWASVFPSDLDMVSPLREPEVERAMFHLWARDTAEDIAKAEGPAAQETSE